jgi:hypothetical protein
MHRQFLPVVVVWLSTVLQQFVEPTAQLGLAGQQM